MTRHQLNPIPKCIGGEECITVGYSILGSSDSKLLKSGAYDWIDDIMKEVALVNQLEFGADVKKLTLGSFDTFLDYLQVNPNSTTYSVVWCTDKWDLTKTTLDMQKNEGKRILDHDEGPALSIPC